MNNPETFRDNIQFQYLSETVDDIGQTVESYINYKKIWCNVKFDNVDITGLNKQDDYSTHQHILSVKLRYDSFLDNNYMIRFNYKNNDYYPISIQEVGRKESLIIKSKSKQIKK